METIVHAKAVMIQFHVEWDSRGKLVVLEYGNNLPFEVKRAFYIYDVPKGESRGGHAHRTCEQVLVAVEGEVDVLIGEKAYHLCDPSTGLYVFPGAPIVMKNFTHDCKLLVLASEKYDQHDYIQ